MMTEEQKRTLRLTDLLREGNWWTTYGTIGEIVYGPGNGAQTVGNTLRDHGRIDSAHRVLNAGGIISAPWIAVGGGPEQAIERLRRERLWDASHDCARRDRFIDAGGLRRLERGASR
jgi:alkylated DNA nucleotide flippase Atl1